MVCLYCHHKLTVSNSRPQTATNSVWRRRSCPECGAIFTSIETLSLANSVRVQHSHGLEPFMKEKLLMSVYESLQHRNEALSEAHDLTETICAQLMQHHIHSAVIQRDQLVAATITILERFDDLAGRHYQARFQS